MDKSKSVSSYLALTALFTVGNAVINLPFKEHTTGSIIGFFAAIILALPFYLKFSYLALPQSKAFNLLFLLYSVFIGLVAFRNFVTFSDRVILPEISSFLPTAAFLILLYRLSNAKFSAILKIALILLILSAAVVILLLILSVENIKLSNLVPNKAPDKADIFYQTAAYFSMSFISGIILIPYNNEKNRKGLLYGFLIGGLLILLSLIQVLTVLGYGTASLMQNPYSTSVGTVTVGSKFSRMEGFSYLLFFSATLINTAVCMKSAKIAYSRITAKGKNAVPLIIVAVYMIFAVFTDVFVNIAFTAILPFLVLPPLVLTIFTLPAKHHTPVPNKTKSRAPHCR